VSGMLSRISRQIREAVRRYFVAGLLAVAPIAITFWTFWWIIRWLDNMLLPPLIRLLLPNLESTPNLPPLVGALFTFLVILLSGVIVRHFFGQELVRLGERLLSRVPIARGIYNGVKQLFEAIVASNDQGRSFNRVVLVEYPRKGAYALAFTTGRARGPVRAALPEQNLVNCFVPTTPNPTSGFYLLVPESDLYDVDLSVEDAFKVIMSAGLVSPGDETS
jgi:uncharacterized membrane protein